MRVERLDYYRKLNAKKQQKEDIARVDAMVEDSSKDILGYHAINLEMMNVDEMAKRPRGAPDHDDLPTLFLGQAAANANFQNRGVGAIRMNHVYVKAKSISK